MCEEFWQPGFTDADDQSRYYSVIGDLLKQNRSAKGFSERTVCDYLQITPEQLQKFENGETAIPLWYFVRLCHILQINYNCRNVYFP